MSSEGFGRIQYHATIRRLLDADPAVRRFMDGETDRLPEFYRARIERELGPLYQYLPEGALMLASGVWQVGNLGYSRLMRTSSACSAKARHSVATRRS